MARVLEKVIERGNKTDREFFGEVTNFLKSELSRIQEGQKAEVIKIPHFEHGTAKFPQREYVNFFPLKLTPSGICLKTVFNDHKDLTKIEGDKERIICEKYKKSVEDLALSVVKKLLDDGFVNAPSKHLKEAVFFRKNLVIDTKEGWNRRFYFKHKDDKGFHGSKIYDWITVDMGWHYIATVSIKANWERFDYLKNEIMPICRQFKHKWLEVDACAPPDYSEKVLYYPLIQLIHYPDGKVEDSTVYCNWNGEYLNETGLKDGVLNRKFEGWDRWALNYLDMSDKNIIFPRIDLSYRSLAPYLYPCNLYIYCNDEDQRDDLYKFIIAYLSKKKNYTLVEHYKKDKRIYKNILVETQSKDKLYIYRKNYTGEYINIYNIYEIGIAFEKWKDELFLYLLELVKPIQNHSYKHIDLLGMTKRDKEGFYPLVRFIWFSDGTFLDLTNYCSKQGKHPNKRGFDAEEILSKNNAKIFNKLIKNTDE